LAPRLLRWGERCLRGPGEPGAGVGKDLGAVFLQRHQILHGIDPGMQTRGDQTREDTGDVGTVLGSIEERILPLPNKEFQRPLGEVIIERRAFNGSKAWEGFPMIL